MKYGSKAAGRATATIKPPAATPSLAIAIPYPAGLTSIIAEEGQSIPHFTPREQQVGGWMAEGKADTEIAGILGIGLQTVKTHVKSLLEKTECDNRNAFVAWAWRNRMTVELTRARPRKSVKYR